MKRKIKDAGSIESESNELVCELSMSPQLAKALNIILEENIKQYETAYGKIPE